MTKTVGQELARETALTRMSNLRMNTADVVRAAAIDTKTVADFLSGKRWPQRANRAAISEALKWPADYLTRIAAGTVDHAAAAVEGVDTAPVEPEVPLIPRVEGLERQVSALWDRIDQLEQLLREGGEGHDGPAATKTAVPGLPHQPGKQGVNVKSSKRGLRGGTRTQPDDAPPS